MDGLVFLGEKFATSLQDCKILLYNSALQAISTLPVVIRFSSFSRIDLTERSVNTFITNNNTILFTAAYPSWFAWQVGQGLARIPSTGSWRDGIGLL